MAVIYFARKSTDKKGTHRGEAIAWLHRDALDYPDSSSVGGISPL